ncbi:biotin--[acetyl-CoA-carboxylase] ligase [Sphingorhabdus sp. EL138]|uniref:biotin--[acetyl-CoA-carboxylase] ligase n=1 Tax=Sphingorhabdus sp. EL138 TaxID=2073156 RepID=UPI0025E93F37|nr:biotin--[acetyl-CoA-carboxylase] ligase [Sphingorhabdus sp. EL138]
MFEEVALTGSTNADLLVRAAQGAPEGLWLRADAQDGGRGRLGRAWESPKGNLFASSIVRLRDTDSSPAGLAFVTAVAAYDAIRQMARQVPIILKWPNDILAHDGSKLCGILLERASDAVIVGIGLNLVWHPQNLDRKVSDLRTLGATPPDAQTAVEIVAEAFARYLNIWRQSGLGNIVRHWEACAHPRGTALSAKLPDGTEVYGLYAGLNDEGALQLRLADGAIRAIHAADVFLI